MQNQYTAWRHSYAVFLFILRLFIIFIYEKTVIYFYRIFMQVEEFTNFFLIYEPKLKWIFNSKD